MAVSLLCLVLFLAMIHRSSGDYCICNNGLTDPVLQKNIDYACGSGADCTPILQNGACYNPNTVKDHCNFAVNSYYQRRNEGPGTCNFSGTASNTQSIPNQVPGCVYPSSGGNSTTPTPTPTPPSPFSNSTTPPSPFLSIPPAAPFNGANLTAGTHLFYYFTLILTLVLPGLMCRS